MRGSTHPEPTGCPYSCFFFLFFSYSTLIFCWFLPFFTTGIRNPGSPRTWRKFACTGPGGASTENRFPDSPEWWVPTKNRPPSSPYAIMCGQRNAAMPWEGLPPHRIVSRSLVFVDRGSAAKPWEGLPPHRIAPHWFCGRDMSWTCRGGNFRTWSC